MRPVSDKMTDGWKREDKTGEYRPTVRATIQRIQLQKFPYSTRLAQGGDWDHQRYRKGVYSSVIFGDESRPIELRGIKNCSWERSLDQDVATCTLIIKNTQLVAIGEDDDSHRGGEHEDSDEDDYDEPGSLTYNRGIDYDDHGWHREDDADDKNPWGYGDRGGRVWQNLIVPDRLVKTYEGYGSDYSKYPENDENLMISGVWLIDKVQLTTEGDITIEMRDVGRMLLTHICFPPAVPFAEYPMFWSKIQSVQVPSRDALGGKWTNLKGKATATSSNKAYVGKGLKDPPYKNYVGPNGHVNGHFAHYALNAENPFNPGDMGQYGGKWWSSTGQTTRGSMVWWEMDFNTAKDVAGLRLDPVAGPYRIYISVKTADGWLGRKKIPYKVTTEGIDNGAKIPFVQAVWADRWNEFDVIFKRKYRNVRKIRLTFTNLSDTHVGNYRWRAMLRDVKAYIGDYDDLHFGKGEKTKVVGNYRDYTQVVKWICAWGGFYWPNRTSKRDFWTTDEDSKRHVHYDWGDPTFVNGRVWGTFQPTRTAGIADLTVDLFDKKPFMDVINYVRDIVGFVFYIDEWGGVVWRMPNLYEKGNYVAPEPTDLETRARRNRTTDYITIDEKKTLLSYSTQLDSENLRERVFVADTTGKVGIVIKGFNPTYEGFRRTAGWTDQNFKTQQETRVMADMIAAQQMFNYRRTSSSTPGYPAIQLDDQIRIKERLTNETYFHYVLGISSNLDMESGEWIYDLETHWLGSDRKDAWLMDVYKLDGATKNYIQVLKGTHNMPD